MRRPAQPPLGVLYVLIAVVSGLPEIRMNAIYSAQPVFNATFGLYYMYTNRQAFRAEIDFEETLSIIRHDRSDVCLDSLVCSTFTYCDIDGQTVQVFDKRTGVYLPTNPAKIFISLPDTIDEGVQHPRRAYRAYPFNLYTGKALIRNMVGMAPKSGFWEHLAQVYGQSSYYVRFDVNFDMQTAGEVAEQPEDVRTSLVFFPATPDRTILREELQSGLEFKNVMLSMGETEMLTEASVNLNNPHLFSLSPLHFQGFVYAVKLAICKDPFKCTSATDLEEESRRSGFMRLHFPNSDSGKGSWGHTVLFPVERVFYVNHTGVLCWNFGEIPEGRAQGKGRHLELGLMFLREVTLYLHYSQTDNKLNAVLAPRMDAKRTSAYISLTLAALIGSLAATVVLYLALGPPTKRIPTIDSPVLV